MRLDGLGLREEVALSLVFFLIGTVVVLKGGDERATMIRFGLEAVVETFSVFFFPNHDVGLPSGNRLDAVPERFLVSPGIFTRCKRSTTQTPSRDCIASITSGRMSKFSRSHYK